MMVEIKDFEMPSCCGNCQMASCKGLSGQFYCDIITYDVDMDNTERDANCPLVEAIPEADYENHLKADMVAMLEELRLEIEEMPMHYDPRDVSDIVQQKINSLKTKIKPQGRSE